MGMGRSFTCRKCGKEYDVFWGIGFRFPLIYEELLEDIKNGKYGQEWKDLVLRGEHVAVDAEDCVYLCKKCGHWDAEPNLSLYAPNDPEAIMKKEAAEEEKVSSYVMSYELKKDYHLLKRRLHKCPECGGLMHRATDSEISRLRCPDCGGIPEENYNHGMILWD